MNEETGTGARAVGIKTERIARNVACVAKGNRRLARNVMAGKSHGPTLISAQPMEMNMATEDANRRTITIVTTTVMIRWWDGEQWVEQTLAPNVEVVSGGEDISNPGASGSDQPNNPDNRGNQVTSQPGTTQGA